MAAGISTRNRARMEKSYLFVEVESLCGATGYPLRTPRLEDTVLDAHTRKPITVITERYLGVLRFCRWSQPGHNQKLAHLISEIHQYFHVSPSPQIVWDQTVVSPPARVGVPLTP